MKDNEICHFTKNFVQKLPHLTFVREIKCIGIHLNNV